MGFDAAVRERVEAYRTALDPQVGTVYRKRKDYEDSVTAINDAVSAYLDAEQEMAQAMFPPYFEKQRTDGVDYSIYVGAALVDGRAYDELYLRNRRLWQLLVACGIARQTELLRQRLPLALDTTHLILAHHAPLSIRFRADEKRFDVDGAYNVRYEVVKKRIDKAMLRGSDERVTHPGQIAPWCMPSPRSPGVSRVPRLPHGHRLPDRDPSRNSRWTSCRGCTDCVRCAWPSTFRCPPTSHARPSRGPPRPFGRSAPKGYSSVLGLGDNGSHRAHEAKPPVHECLPPGGAPPRALGAQPERDPQNTQRRFTAP
jgi:hypothetical protein